MVNVFASIIYGYIAGFTLFCFLILLAHGEWRALDRFAFAELFAMLALWPITVIVVIAAGLVQLSNRIHGRGGDHGAGY